MNARVDQLLNEALELRVDERSALVVALIESLDGIEDASITDAWRDEIRRRRAELGAGRVRPVPWAEAKTRLRQA